MSGSDWDDQTYWENRRADEQYEREKSERDAEIARGFSHNSEALNLYYDTSETDSLFSADDEDQIYQSLLSEKASILNGISSWAGLGLVSKDKYVQALNLVDLMSVRAEDQLKDLLHKLEGEKRLWSPTNPLNRQGLPAEFYGDLNRFETRLHSMLETYDLYRTIRRSRRS